MRMGLIFYGQGRMGAWDFPTPSVFNVNHFNVVSFKTAIEGYWQYYPQYKKLVTHHDGQPYKMFTL